MWSLLHQGVLTTGYLPATLGFFEPQAAKRLGLPKARVSHKHLLDAYQRLLLPQYCPPQHPASPRGTASSAAEVAAAAELHNALAVERFNAGKAARPSGSPPLPHRHWCAPGQPEGAAVGHAPSLNRAGSGQTSTVANGGLALGHSGDAGSCGCGRHAAQQGSSVAPSAGAGGSKSKSRNRRDRKARREQQQQQHDVQTRSLAEMECAETTVNGEEEQPRVSRQSKLGGLSEDEKLRLARSLGQQGGCNCCLEQ